jgi:hypothetical protein
VDNFTPRHHPGTIYACDASHYGADRRLCPVHAAAPDLLTIVLRCRNLGLLEQFPEAIALVNRLERNP